MKLDITNFRCISKAVYDFGDKGITLISGRSGLGKSSIFEAIYFVLYGESRNIIKYGETGCKVILWYEDYKIIRTKGPNKLIVKNHINELATEGKPAQEIIYSIFGTNFHTISYFSQDMDDNFISLSPLNKLLFLEKITLMDISSQKTKLKSLIREREDSLLEIQSQVKVMKEVISHKSKPVEVAFPIPCSKKNQEIIIKNEYIRQKNSLIRKTKVIKELRDLKEKINNQQLLKERISDKEISILSLTKALSDIQTEKDGLFYIGDESLAELENSIQIIKNNIEYEKLNDSYKQTKAQYTFILLEQQKLMEGLLPLDEIEKQIIDLEEYIRDITLYITLKSKVKEPEFSYDIIVAKINQLETLLQNKIYTCPGCNISLYFKNDKLNLYNSSPQNTSNIKKEITSLQAQKQESLLQMKLTSQMKDIENKYDALDPDILSFQEDLSNLKKQKETHSLCSFKKKEEEALLLKLKNIKIQKNKINKKSIFDSSYTIESLTQKITEQKNIKYRISQIEKSMDSLAQKININQEELKILKQNEDKNIDINQLDILRNKINEYQKGYELHTLNIEKIEAWNKYIKEKADYDSFLEKLSGLESKEKITLDKLSAANILTVKIKEAESFAITSIISSINSYSKVYIDKFFENKEIQVTLVAFKESGLGKKAKVKAQINLQILYEGRECDFSSLSGGEKDRISLAFTLALAEIMSSPILLLDESFKSLDQETSNQVITSLRENYKGKICVIIAHQIIQGAFDKVISLQG